MHGDSADQLTQQQYRRFLVDSPLLPVAPGGLRRPAPACGLGSFHQAYWLDGRIVAVGVVDVLPRCLSSKYLFWEPELSGLSLGKLTALREIDWVRSASQARRAKAAPAPRRRGLRRAAAQAAGCEALQYYYMGFYIHSCPKMRYKAAFRPSEIQCPTTRAWHPLERVLPQLEASSGCAHAELGSRGFLAGSCSLFFCSVSALLRKGAGRMPQPRPEP